MLIIWYLISQSTLKIELNVSSSTNVIHWHIFNKKPTYVGNKLHNLFAIDAPDT